MTDPEHPLTTAAPDEVPIVILPDEVDLASLPDLVEPEAFDDEDASLVEADHEVESDIDDEIEDELSREQLELDRRVSLIRLGRVTAWILVAALGLLLLAGWSYYLLGVAERPFHHLHVALRPSGTFGLLLGIIGTALMVSSLAYLVRKSVFTWKRLGALQTWMGFHILAGLLGPLFILFHACFHPTSAMGALAFASMLVIVGSGVMGRYILAYVPRTLKPGEEPDLETVHRRLVVYRRKLVELGVDSSLLAVDETPVSTGRSPWLLTAIVHVVCGDRESREEFRRLRAAACAKGRLRGETRKILILVRKVCQERQWYVRYRELRKLIGAWRFAHRWLAVVMLAAVFFHIAVAIKFGDLALLGRGN